MFTAIRGRCVKVPEILDSNPNAENASWWIDNRDRLPNPARMFNQIKMMMSNGQTLEDAVKATFGF